MMLFVVCASIHALLGFVGGPFVDSPFGDAT
jgi:hypothetical protein